MLFFDLVLELSTGNYLSCTLFSLGVKIIVKKDNTNIYFTVTFKIANNF